jgi:hypothetical protein
MQLLAAGRTREPRRAQIRPALATSMSGSSSIGRGRGHISRASPLRDHGDDDKEARRFTKYGIRPPPGFKKWEARANQGRPLPGSPTSAPAAHRRSRYDAGASRLASGASSSRVSRASMKVDATPPLRRVLWARRLARRTSSPTRLSPASSS